jgi:hypothetical protein
LAWAIVAVVLACGSFAGGDMAILCGLAFLVWAAPFSMIWQFYIYGSALKVLPQTIIDPLGIALIIPLSYVFWFLAIPWLFSAVRQSQRGRKS